MTAFDEAWAVVKADTGMWDEIYAPLYEQLGGRGSGPSSERLPALDFLPTNVAMEKHTRHLSQGEPMIFDDDAEKHLEYLRGSSKGDHGFAVEQLKERIMDEGFRIPDKIMSGRSQFVLPNFAFDDEGHMRQYEGRHRTLALHELGAPYIPSFGRGQASRLYSSERIAPPWKVNPIFRDPKLSEYSAAAYYGPDKGRYSAPPSWIFDQEIVPGMGKLSPTIGGKTIPLKDMINHIHHSDKLDMDEWVNRPEWSVIHDD